MIGSAERNSEHVLANAIVDYIQRSAPNVSWLEPTQFEAWSGLGIAALFSNVNGASSAASNRTVRVAIGSRRLMSDLGIELTSAQESIISEYQAAAHTVLLVAIDSMCCGLLTLVDRAKPDAPMVVRELSAMGIEVWMCTGDNQATAEAVAKQCGICNVVVCA